ncbi:hypothetical protein [Streptomyces sp. NPDC048172]|uniref:hypothetical protein n=1 Tax=Streptomyces sp. NPDC048172 TaxID=3365505 RepID=UPI003715CD3D
MKRSTTLAGGKSVRTRTPATLLATGGLALGLLSATAPTASADATSPSSTSAKAEWRFKNAKNVTGQPPRGTSRAVCTWVHVRSKTLGKVCFERRGDRFWVKDMRSDGKYIVMRAMYTGNPQTLFDCRDFKGKRAGWTRCGFANLVKENRRISFSAVVYKGRERVAEGSTATVMN